MNAAEVPVTPPPAISWWVAVGSSRLLPPVDWTEPRNTASSATSRWVGSLFTCWDMISSVISIFQVHLGLSRQQERKGDSPPSQTSETQVIQFNIQETFTNWGTRKLGFIYFLLPLELNKKGVFVFFFFCSVFEGTTIQYMS